MDVKIKVSIKNATPEILGGALRAAFTAATAQGAVISMSSGKEEPAPEPEPVALPLPEPEPESVEDGFTDGDGTGQAFSPDAAPAPEAEITETQIRHRLTEMCRTAPKGIKAEIRRVLGSRNADSLDDLPASEYAGALSELESWVAEHTA